MADEQKDLIKQRAYAIWEREGRPHGRDAEHWRRAQEEMHGLEDAPKIVKTTPHLAPAGKKDKKR